MTENEAIEVLEKSTKHIKVAHKTKNGMDFLIFSSDWVKANEMAIQALEEIQQYRAIGTVEELKALKENERKCEDCAGCTEWLCDCANVRAKAIDEFAEKAIRVVYEANNRERNPKPRDMVADIHYKMMEIAEQMRGAL